MSKTDDKTILCYLGRLCGNRFVSFIKRICFGWRNDSKKKSVKGDTPQGVLSNGIIAVFQNKDGSIQSAQTISNEEYMKIFITGKYIDFSGPSKDGLQVVVLFKEK